MRNNPSIKRFLMTAVLLTIFMITLHSQEPDGVKKETFLRAGFKPIGQLRGELNTGSQEIDVTILEKTR